MIAVSTRIRSLIEVIHLMRETTDAKRNFQNHRFHSRLVPAHTCVRCVVGRLTDMKTRDDVATLHFGTRTLGTETELIFVHVVWKIVLGF